MRRSDMTRTLRHASRASPVPPQASGCSWSHIERASGTWWPCAASQLGTRCPTARYPNSSSLREEFVVVGTGNWSLRRADSAVSNHPRGAWSAMRLPVVWTRHELPRTKYTNLHSTARTRRVWQSIERATDAAIGRRDRAPRPQSRPAGAARRPSPWSRRERPPDGRTRRPRTTRRLGPRALVARGGGCKVKSRARARACRAAPRAPGAPPCARCGCARRGDSVVK